MRAALRVDDLPVAIGRISDSKQGTAELTWAHGELLREAQARFVHRDRSARLITETDDYQYSDPWHYDTRGYLELGERFAEAVLSIPRPPMGSMFEEGAKLTVEVGDGAGGEGPAWDAELGVLTSGNGNINRWSRDRVASVFREGAGTNGLLFDTAGRLVACEPKLRRVTRMDRDGTLNVLTDNYEGKAYNTPNDLTLDSQGRIYFSDPRYGDRDDMAIRNEQGQTVEGVYRIDLDGTVSRVIGREVDRANGVLVTSDDEYLLVADNNNNTNGVTRALWRFDLNTDGSVDLATKKKLFDWGQGRGPDGLAQDAQGHLYVAAGLNRSNPPFEPDSSYRGGIYVLDLDGRLLDFVAVPTDEVTNCAFGGEDGKTLYITGGGTLYSIRCKFAGT
jgi:gluconolactonase